MASATFLNGSLIGFLRGQVDRAQLILNGLLKILGRSCFAFLLPLDGSRVGGLELRNVCVDRVLQFIRRLIEIAELFLRRLRLLFSIR